MKIKLELCGMLTNILEWCCKLRRETRSGGKVEKLLELLKLLELILQEEE